MSNLQKWGDWSAETAETEKEELQKSGGGAEFLPLVTGRNVVRVMPPRPGARTPFVTVYQHYIKLPGSTKPVVFACPRMQKKLFCPACEHADKLRATGNPADYKTAGDFMAKRRVFANAISRKDPEKGPLVLAFGKTVHEQLVALRTDEDAGGNFTDPVKGFDIIIEKTGEGLKTEYAVRPARNQTPLGDMAWLEQMHDLERYAAIAPLNEIKRMMGIEVEVAATAQARPARARGRSAEDDAVDLDE